MYKKPKPKNEGIFAHGMAVRTILQGCMFAILSLAAFYLGEKFTGQTAGGQTMAFMVLSLSQIIQSFNMRSERSLFKIGPFSNKNLNLAVLVSVLLTLLVLFTPVSTAFGLIRLPGKAYGIAVCLILVPLAVMEISKALGLIKSRKH